MEISKETDIPLKEEEVIKSHEESSGLTKEQIQTGLKFSIIEGIIVTLGSAFLGGIFMTNYLVYILKISNLQFGILSSIGPFCSLVMLITSYFIEKGIKRKILFIVSAFVARFTWIFIFAVPIIFLKMSLFNKFLLFAVISIIINIFSIFSNTAYTSLLVDLVPEKIRGRYFARKGIICGVIGTIFGIAVARLSDFLPRDSIYTYLWIFTPGILISIFSLFFFNRIPEPKFYFSKEKINFTGKIVSTFKNPEFLKLITFTIIWCFGGGICGPYYTLFMIKSIHMSNSMIVFFGTFSGIIVMLSTPIWGNIIDRSGNKPVIFFVQQLL